MKGLSKFLTTARTILKYVGLIFVIFDIIEYAINKIEQYAIKKQPENLTVKEHLKNSLEENKS